MHVRISLSIADRESEDPSFFEASTTSDVRGDSTGAILPALTYGQSLCGRLHSEMVTFSSPSGMQDSLKSIQNDL